jgi:hypothetical protein
MRYFFLLSPWPYVAATPLFDTIANIKLKFEGIFESMQGPAESTIPQHLEAFLSKVWTRGPEKVVISSYLETLEPLGLIFSISRNSSLHFSSSIT